MGIRNRLCLLAVLAFVVTPSHLAGAGWYWIPAGSSDDGLVLSAGPRFMGARLSADIALAISPDNGGFFPR